MPTRERADQMQQLIMTSISNIRCSIIHRGTIADGQVTSEKICLVADNMASACNGRISHKTDDFFEFFKIVYKKLSGDSGKIVGVTSWRIKPCGSYPSVFIRVLCHLEWIQQQMWTKNFNHSADKSTQINFKTFCSIKICFLFNFSNILVLKGCKHSWDCSNNF